jgi:hypothetical protein
MPTGPPRADHTQGHDVGVLARLAGRGGRGRTGRHQVAAGTACFLAVLIGPTCSPRSKGADGYLRMLTALATTRIATSSEIASSAIIMSLAQGLIAETSVGLNAAAFVNDR